MICTDVLIYYTDVLRGFDVFFQYISTSVHQYIKKGGDLLFSKPPSFLTYFK
jgi:hypothetical protein